MSRHEICPSCGTKLGASQTRGATRTCSACHRSNPSGFSYCGFCASPMEDTQMRARMSELAAPPGGWPNLTSELVEVRFYLQQGLLDDAYELLSIMQKRHPGHPQLDELTHRPKPARRVDTDTIALVDSVLAESANLVGRVPRRAAPRWKAPAASASPRTAGHPTSEERSEAAAPRTTRTGKTGANATTGAARGTGTQRQVPPTSSRSTTGTQRATHKPSGSQPSTRRPGGTGSQPRTGARVEASEVEPVSPREHTRIYRTVEPPRTVIEARAAELARVEAARSRAAAPASTTDDRDRAARAKAARAAERAEAARVAEQAAVERAHARATELARAEVPKPSSTVVVDVLQPAAPFAGTEDAAARPKTARKRREAAAPAPAGARAPAPSETPAAATSTASSSEPKEARKRRASFGEHVLNRLR